MSWDGFEAYYVNFTRDDLVKELLHIAKQNNELIDQNRELKLQNKELIEQNICYDTHVTHVSNRT